MNVARFGWLSALLTAVNNENFCLAFENKIVVVVVTFFVLNSDHRIECVTSLFGVFFFLCFDSKTSRKCMFTTQSIDCLSLLFIHLHPLVYLSHVKYRKKIEKNRLFFRAVIQLFDVFLKILLGIEKKCEWYGKLIECKCDINESKTNKTRFSFMQNQFYNLLKWYLLSNMCPIGDVIIIINLFQYGTWKRCEWPTNDTKRNSPQKHLKKKPHYN